MNASALRTAFGQAAGTLMAHRLQTVLSSLGIVVGTATIVAVLAIGEGGRRAAYNEIGALGIDNIFVRAARPTGMTDEKRRMPAPSLFQRDAEAIRLRVREAQSVATVRSARVEIAAGGRHLTATVAGVSLEWVRIANLQLARGRWLTRLDDRGARRVAVAGSAIARQLFGGQNAVGEEVHAAGAWYQIVGVLEDTRDGNTREGSIQRFDPAESLMVPIGTLDVSLGEHDSLDRVEEIALRISSAEDVERARLAIQRVLDRDRRPGVHDYELVIPRALLNARLRSQRSFNAFVLAIGFLTLVIGGIGIMNVMLTIVTERAPEIGLRRAVGATERDIVAQFTTEAALLSLGGAATGIPLGALMAAAVAQRAEWPIAISVFSIVLALALALGTGMASGVYPALRAARLDPAVALRAE